MNEQDFLMLFLEEAVDILESWELHCQSLREAVTHEALTGLFRAAHNMKGSSRSVGLLNFGAFLHKIEDQLTPVLNNGKEFPPELLDLLFDSHVMLVDWVHMLRKNCNAVKDVSSIVARLEMINELHASRRTVESKPSAAFGFFDAEDPSPPALPSPANQWMPQQAESRETKDIGSLLMESGNVSQEQVEKAVRIQNRKLGEILVDEGMVPATAVPQALEAQKKLAVKPDETIRISLLKLDSILRMIGELSIHHSIIRNAHENEMFDSESFREALILSSKVIHDLQRDTMSLRLQSLDNLLKRMHKVVLDLAKDLNKTIDVELKGLDVELDKTVIERMKDPLVHILRNAVDHGIESAEQRQLAGKSSIAKIKIEGRQTASHVSIVISDDGKGLDEEMILAKAKALGLISQDRLLSSKEIQHLIFVPGFSTAEKITEVSGRGVGMDVVNRSVSDLGGTIAIESEKGKGTTFSISLPSTLSILDAIVVQLSGNLYAVPIQDIEEVVDLGSIRIETSTNRGNLISLRGQVMPIEALSDYLPTKAAKAPSSQQSDVALIAKHAQKSVAFAVDCIKGQQSIVVRRLEGGLQPLPGISGGTILANGEPALIIQLPHLVKSFLAQVA